MSVKLAEEIKELKTWDEASRWLARHGYGIEQIRIQKELWASKNNKPVEINKSETPAKTTSTKN